MMMLSVDLHFEGHPGLSRLAVLSAFILTTSQLHIFSYVLHFQLGRACPVMAVNKDMRAKQAGSHQMWLWHRKLPCSKGTKSRCPGPNPDLSCLVPYSVSDLWALCTTCTSFHGSSMGPQVGKATQDLSRIISLSPEFPFCWDALWEQAFVLDPAVMWKGQTKGNVSNSTSVWFKSCQHSSRVTLNDGTAPRGEANGAAKLAQRKRMQKQKQCHHQVCVRAMSGNTEIAPASSTALSKTCWRPHARDEVILQYSMLQKHQTDSGLPSSSWELLGHSSHPTKESSPLFSATLLCCTSNSKQNHF